MSVHNLFKDDEDHNYFHSSEYAKAASGKRLGVVDTTTFNERYRLDRSRKMVKRYDHSHVARYYSRDRTEIVDGKSSVQAQNAPRSTGFHEPPVRHNPYA